MSNASGTAPENSTLSTNSAKSTLGWTLAATSFGFVVVQLDVTIVNVAMPQMGAQLGADMSGLQWIVDAYTLAFASLLLSAGALGDRLGSLRVFLAGLVLFGVSSLACALAPSVGFLIAARALQGVAAALILPTSLALLSHACAGDALRRTHAIGWWSAIGGAVSAAGPLVGGALVTGLGWRSIFYINLPICALGWWAARRHVAETETIASRRMDLSGQVLVTLALFFVTHAVIEAGALGWGHTTVLAGMAVSAVVIALFIRNEMRVADPMIPMALFRSKAFSVPIILAMTSNLTFYGLIFVMSLYFQRVKGYSPTLTGAALLPFAVIMLANLSSGHLARRYSPRVPIIAGSALSALSFVLLHGMDQNTPYLHILPSLLLLAIGGGISTPALTSMVLGSIEPARAATASAIFGASRQVGSAMGVAVAGAFLMGDAAQFAAGAALSFDVFAVIRIVGVVLALVLL